MKMVQVYICVFILYFLLDASEYILSIFLLIHYPETIHLFRCRYSTLDITGLFRPGYICFRPGFVGNIVQGCCCEEGHRVLGLH